MGICDDLSCEAGKKQAAGEVCNHANGSLPRSLSQGERAFAPSLGAYDSDSSVPVEMQQKLHVLNLGSALHDSVDRPHALYAAATTSSTVLFTCDTGPGKSLLPIVPSWWERLTPCR
jgi:hypothetical protein